MAAQTTTFVIQDAELNDGTQYDTVGASSDLVLTALEVRGQFNMDGQVATSSYYPNMSGSSVLVGAQIVPEGGSPVSISSDQDSDQWLWLQYVADQDTLGILEVGSTAWTSYFYQQFAVTRTWKGQLLVASGAIIYITTTSIADPKRTWVFSGTVRAFWDART